MLGWVCGAGGLGVVLGSTVLGFLEVLGFLDSPFWIDMPPYPGSWAQEELHAAGGRRAEKEAILCAKCQAYMA